MESEPGLTATYEQTKDSQKTDNLPIKEKREIFGVPHVPLNLLISCLAEKGGSRTLRGPYDPQTGFEDQRHHRAPSFSDNEINYLRGCHPFLFINSFINLRGPEGVGNVGEERATYQKLFNPTPH